MTAGERVRFNGPDWTTTWALGTVREVTRIGYVVVNWDDGVKGVFSPVMASEQLVVVTGDDDKPRHDWTECDVCGVCGVTWAADLSEGPCYGPAQADGVR